MLVWAMVRPMLGTLALIAPLVQALHHKKTDRNRVSLEGRDASSVNASLLVAVDAVDKPAKPHIIFVVADDLGYNDMGYKGSGIATPNLDRLAAVGTKLENYYVQHSCAPTRATIMTGRHVVHHGVYTPFVATQPEGVPLDETFLPEVLRDQAGYDTHMVGKWHLGFYRQSLTPTFRGFNSFYGFYVAQQDYFSHRTVAAQAGYSRYDFRREERPRCGVNCSIIEETNGRYSTYLFTKRAEKIILNRTSTKPLFLYLAWQAVHAPEGCPEAKKQEFANSTRSPVFACMLTLMDRGMGKIIDALQEKKMLQNSYIVFTTDNGGAVSTNEKVNDDIGSSNWPLRGGKHTLFEGGLRGVGFVWAGWWNSSKYEIPKTYNGLMGSVDWLPTLAQMAGISNPQTNGAIDGRSQWAPLSGTTGATSPHRHLFLSATMRAMNRGGKGGGMSFALRRDRWKLIAGVPAEGQGPFCFGWSHRNGSNLNFIEEPDFTQHHKILLFDVVSDPGERIDLAAARPEVVKELRLVLKAYRMASIKSSLRLDYPKAVPLGDTWGPWGPEADD